MKSASGKWILSISTDGLFTGTYLYYAVVNDNHAGSTIASAQNTVIAPPNDNFSHAQTIIGLSATIAGSNENATLEPGEPAHAGNDGGASVWYTWTAPATGLVNLTAGSDAFETLLGVYLGTSVSMLTAITSSDADNTSNLVAVVSFKALKGTKYDFAVDGHNFDDGNGPGEGAFTLTLAMPAQVSKPANDNFASAQALSGPSVSVTGSNVNATRESGEPIHAGNDGGASVWYAWTASSTGTVSLDTHGSSFDTLLAVYTGTSISQLTSIASNDDTSATDPTSQLTFNAVAGTRYHIVVDGYNSDTGTGPAEGSIALHLTEKASAATPKAVAAKAVNSTTSGTSLSPNDGDQKKPAATVFAGLFSETPII